MILKYSNVLVIKDKKIMLIGMCMKPNANNINNLFGNNGENKPVLLGLDIDTVYSDYELYYIPNKISFDDVIDCEAIYLSKNLAYYLFLGRVQYIDDINKLNAEDTQLIKYNKKKYYLRNKVIYTTNIHDKDNFVMRDLYLDKHFMIIDKNKFNNNFFKQKNIEICEI